MSVTNAPESSEDHDVLRRLRAGDEATFMMLVDRHHAAMVRLARMYVSSVAVAEEVVQDAWLGIVKGLDGFANRSSLRTWMYRIVANIAKTRGVQVRRSTPFSSLVDEDAVSGM